jgi:hypothetical protein
MSEFRDIQRGCPYRVQSERLGRQLWELRLVAEEEVEQITHFCIRRGGLGFMGVEGVAEFSGFGRLGDPCMEGVCVELRVMRGEAVSI